MKLKATLMILMPLLYMSTSGVVSAQTSVSGHSTIKAQIGHNSETDSSIGSTDVSEHDSVDIEHGNATSASMRSEHESTTEETHGLMMSETHRSVVATFVQSLLNVANHEGGIGSQVRVVAESQHESASTTADAMTKVESRGSLHTFLVGSDYKNLGVIRSEIASTTANLLKLKTLLSQATSDADKAELNTQITALQKEQTNVETYVTVHENAFSLFGWLNKLFN